MDKVKKTILQKPVKSASDFVHYAHKMQKISHGKTSPHRCSESFP